MGENRYVDGAKTRLHTIRLRTWTLTLVIVIALVFYFLVTIVTREGINWVDFILLCVMQIITHSLYFPDGDIFGQKDKAYQANKKSYNEKAESINRDKKIARLREYCKVEYEERKRRYIQNECDIIGITLEELELLKKKTESEIKTIESFKVNDALTIHFSKFKRRRLYALIFKKIPVEENLPETIMSAIEINTNKAIRDGSIVYRYASFIKKAFKAIVVGGIFAYIGYTARNGIGLAEVVSVIMYLTTLFSTAVFAFGAGENCSKVHKSQFYLELSNFIDGFNEWNDTKNN